MSYIIITHPIHTYTLTICRAQNKGHQHVSIWYFFFFLFKYDRSRCLFKTVFDLSSTKYGRTLTIEGHYFEPWCGWGLLVKEFPNLIIFHFSLQFFPPSLSAFIMSNVWGKPADNIDILPLQFECCYLNEQGCDST